MALVALLMLGLFFFYTRDLPSLNSLADYHPKEITRVYSDDGELIAQYYVERRTVVSHADVPQLVINAFLAAEDATFYQHEGLDYWGLARAVMKGVLHGFHFKGTSTITQQVVKTLVTGPERTLRRKVREAVLTKRLEQTLSKDDILQLYLNQIVFGRGNYGVEEASQAYFGKHVRDLTLAEAAILGGIPKNPEKYNPQADLRAVKERQKYVLDQMVEKGFASRADADAAFAQPILTQKAEHLFLGKAPHYAEVVRRQLEAKYGADKLYTGGLTVYTAADAHLQLEAHEATRAGLRELDKRQGYRGAMVRLEPDEFQRAQPLLAEGFKDRSDAWLLFHGAAAAGGDPLIWDLTGAKKSDFEHPDHVKDHMLIKRLAEGDDTSAMVTAVEASKATVHLGSIDAILPLKEMAWARRFNPTEKTPLPHATNDVLRRGDLVLVKIEKVARNNKTHEVTGATVSLDQEPRAEGAFVVIDPHTRFVRALVGGNEWDSTGLIRATQAKRQPGSSFKAIVYTAAMASRELTPATLCADTPIVMRDPWTGDAWKPKNFEVDSFDGDIVLRTALARSKNTCSVKVAEKIGIDALMQMAKTLGIDETFPRNMTLALGTGEVTPIELVNAYATIADEGRYAEPIFVRKVKDHQGNVLDEFESQEGEERITPDVAYVMTQMLSAVINEQGGTGAAARGMHPALVGKTGTSQDARDAWFLGMTPDIVAGAWVGFDDDQSLGPETGAKAALPVWMKAMRRYLTEHKEGEWEKPEEGVTEVSIDTKTGLLASPGDANAVTMAFLAGTEPVESASQATTKDFFDEDSP